ncbi:MAG: hypothetical protein GY789_28880, partial [Hyphomicrobiales bacterium]|nr:hypothetical protein [Hyphomicrobiales bacterium]
MGVTAVYLLVFVRMVSPAERTHLIEYGVLAVFIHKALAECANNGRSVPVPALLAVLATALLGVIDECIQAFLPIRVFDPLDIVVTNATTELLSQSLPWHEVGDFTCDL